MPLVSFWVTAALLLPRYSYCLRLRRRRRFSSSSCPCHFFYPRPVLKVPFSFCCVWSHMHCRVTVKTNERLIKLKITKPEVEVKVKIDDHTLGPAGPPLHRGVLVVWQSLQLFICLMKVDGLLLAFVFLDSDLCVLSYIRITNQNPYEITRTVDDRFKSDNQKKGLKDDDDDDRGLITHLFVFQIHSHNHNRRFLTITVLS